MRWFITAAAFAFLPAVVGCDNDEVNDPEPVPDDRQVTRIEDYQYRRNTYFFLDTFYRVKFREYASLWVHVDPNNPILRLEVYKSGPSYDVDADAMPGVAYRQPGMLATRIDSTEAYRGFFKRLQSGTDYVLEPRLGFIRMATRVNDGEVLAVAFENANDGVVGDIEYVPDPAMRRPIRLKLIKDRTARPSRDPNHTWHLEWKNVYDLGGPDIPEEGFEVKIFFKLPASDPQERLAEAGNKNYLEIFGLDVRNLNGNLIPDNLIDIDPAVVNLARGELIFPDPRPFDPSGGPFQPGGVSMNGVDQPILLPLDLHVPVIMYDTTSQSEINRASKFFIQVKARDQ